MSDQTGRILTALDSLVTGQAAIVGRLDALEVGQGAIVGRLDGLETGQAAIVGRLDALEAGQSTIVGRVSGVEAGLDRLRVDVMARMDRLQEVLVQVQSDITVNFGNTERVDRRA
jgi:hypothetical protein